MQIKIISLLLCLWLLPCPESHAEEPVVHPTASAAVETRTQLAGDAPEMLASLLELRRNLNEQIHQTQKKLQKSDSDSEKATLKDEIALLDKQLSESAHDFERIATGIEPALFSEKKPETFSWKEELASLVEPAIKELKRFTVRAREKTELKDRVVELETKQEVARQAVKNLNTVLEKSENSKVKEKVQSLLPEWNNVNKRIENKLDLTRRELSQLEEQEVSLVESSSKSIGTFFKNRGLYLILSVLAFFSILALCRLLYRAVVALTARLTKKQEQRSFNIRLLYIIFQISSVLLAVAGMFFVLYLAEDWFLLSMAIIFFLGFAWTVRQVMPKLWQQGRLMLNLGSVRENERLILHGVPWRVDSINVFCKLVNPSLQVELRLPIENLIGLTSRPYKPEEPWFPCKKGDWVVVGSASRARVVSLSHEQVETVERGGRRVTYPTSAFLDACPANLSRNFRIRVPFGLSYDLQKDITNTIPATLKEYIETQLKEVPFGDKCMNLQVEFYQANSSSLDLMILADFDGQVADIFKKIERAIQKWCVDCCTENGWEIPFPQLTLHQPGKE